MSASLAELTDVEDRLGRDLDESESRRAQALLDDASAVVRNYCRRDFTRTTATQRLRPRGDKVVLPQRPVIEVTAISSVVSFGPTTQITPLSYWSWAGGHDVYLGDQTLVINGPTIDFTDENVWVDVTYTYGYDEIPADVLSVVANLVARGLTVPSGGLVDLETVGPYTTRFASFTQQGPLGLSQADRDILNKYRVAASHTVELRS